MSDIFQKCFKQPDEVLDPIPTPEGFTKLVDKIVSRYNMSYMDAMLEICEHYDREPASVKELITPKLQLELMQEASSRKLLKDNKFSEIRLG